MSRSRAKTYRITRIDTDKKRHANKIVRRILDVPSGNFFKRLYQSWNICDGGRARYMTKTDFWFDEASRK